MNLILNIKMTMMMMMMMMIEFEHALSSVLLNLIQFNIHFNIL